MISINFVKKRNAHIFRITCAISAVGPLLERCLIVNFKNRQFVDLRANNFAVIKCLKYKILTIWPRRWCHCTLSSYKSKSFLLNYFWINCRKRQIKFRPRQKSSFNVMSVYYRRVRWIPVPSPCRIKIKNSTQSKWCEIFLKQIINLPKVLLKISKKDIIIKEKNVKYQIWKIIS